MSKILALLVCSVTLVSVANAQILQQANGTYLSPFCTVADETLSTVPGAKAYANTLEGHALRKADGGLIAVSAERGIGCDVTLRDTGKKIIADVVVRRVSFEPLLMDKDKILLAEPKTQTEYWKKEVDLTDVDHVEFSQSEVPLNMKLAVSVLRTKP